MNSLFITYLYIKKNAIRLQEHPALPTASPNSPPLRQESSLWMYTR